MTKNYTWEKLKNKNKKQNTKIRKKIEKVKLKKIKKIQKFHEELDEALLNYLSFVELL